MLNPFLSSVILAFLLYPLVIKINKILDKIKTFKINRLLSIVFTYLLFISFLLFICFFVLPDVFISIKDIVSKMPEYIDQLQKLLESFNINANKLNIDTIESVIISKSQALMSDLANFIPNVVETSKTVVSIIFNGLITFVFSIYLLIDLNRIMGFLNYAGESLFGKRKNTKLKTVIFDCTSSINSFLIGKIIDSIIMGILLFIILNIFGFKYALLISFIVGVTNIIPDIGPFIGAIPGCLIYLAISPKSAFIFLVIILCLQQFDGMFLGPKILGKKLGIRPVLILPSVIVGGYYFGILGMILGVPLVSVLAIYFNNFLKARKEKQDSNKENDEE